jgi:hypothetical protein
MNITSQLNSVLYFYLFYLVNTIQKRKRVWVFVLLIDNLKAAVSSIVKSILVKYN